MKPFTKAKIQDPEDKLTFIDLFSGIGGFRIGMEQAGFDCVFSNDYDKYANQTYKAWFGDANHSEKSLFDVDIENEIASHDVLCGGFPCQPFSNAGKKLGFDDKHQGNLFFRIVDIAKSKSPKVIFLENVRTLLTHDSGYTFQTINRMLTDLGYIPAYEIINTKYWTPQNRSRVFMVYLHEKIASVETVNDVNRQLIALKEGEGREAQSFSSIMDPDPDKSYQIPQGTYQALIRHKNAHRQKGNGFGFGLMEDFTKQTRTLSARYAKDGAEILIKQKYWRRPRKITMNEAKGLMGFTDDYAKKYNFENGFPIVGSNTQVYKQFGNAVVPGVIEEIAKIIITILD